MLRFGLIGMGAHGSRYAAHLAQDVPGARLAAVCRRDRAAGEAWAAAHGARFYEDYDGLIADPGVDAVAAVTTPDLHLDIARKAASRGKHLLIEKPLSVNAMEAARLARAVAGSPVTVMVAQTLRWNSVVRALREHANEVGTLHVLRLSQRMEGQPHPWQRDEAVAGGGNILHTGIHLFDLVRHLTGDEVEAVSCETRRVHNPALEDVFAAVMRLAGSGALVLVDSSKATRSRSARIELVGEGGQLVGDHVHGYARRITGYEIVDLAPAAPVHTVREALSDFVAAVSRGGPPPVTVEDGLRAVEIAEACYRSAASRGPVAVERASPEALDVRAEF
ncbi:MAG: Gfo/Idh/MocA family oxidoreductase [Deltaproteobacteria bacterium]|nr:Gfo/Idh/MocA family oxidoreductase [Deltaproteobacteria bacterium]